MAAHPRGAAPGRLGFDVLAAFPGTPDSATAALGVAQTRQVLDLVRRLADRGLAVVLISHNLHDIFEVADRISVLRLGQRVNVFTRTNATQQQIVHAITAGELEHVLGIGGDVTL